MNEYGCTCCGKEPATHHYCHKCYIADCFDTQERHARLLAAAKVAVEYQKIKDVMPRAAAEAIERLAVAIREAEEGKE